MYAGIASGRVVVVGAPGAGKTGAAILLLLDALEHRDRVDDKDRIRVPVPVLLTAYSWDPVTCSVRDWLAARLAADYPLFQHRGGQAEANNLVAAGAVALLLDGLDEMDLAQRTDALQALSDAPFRVVVITRSEEMVQAATYLVGAIAVQLHDVTGPKGAAYLHRARTGPAPAGWAQLLTHLRENPDSVLTHGLSTPLALTLIRDTYRPGDDVNELLTATRSGTADDLEQHLIARVLPAAYTPRPGRPAPRYSITQARQALTFLARRMNQDHTRDLAWWHIPRWAPTRPRVVTSLLAGGLMGGLLGGMTSMLVYAVVAGLGTLLRVHGLWGGLGIALQLGATFGFGVGLALGLCFWRGGREPKRVRNWRAINVRSLLAYGLAHGLAYGLAVMLLYPLMFMLAALLLGSVTSSATVGLVATLVLGLTMGLTLGNHDLLRRQSKGTNSSQRLAKSRRIVRQAGIVGRIALGLLLVLLVPLVLLVLLVPLLRLVFRLLFRLAGGFVARIAAGSTEGEGSPQKPLESWRNDRVFGLAAGLAFGLPFGLPYGIGLGLAVGHSSGLAAGLVAGLGTGLVVTLAAGLLFALAVGLPYGITSSETWPTTLTWRLQLRRSHHVPAVGLMPFLEDARERGVLRTAGAVYQFRHATLQDQLAGHTTSNPATSPTAQHPS
ncbi:MAG: hypothetical protein ACRDRU_15530 [Pseudonocardiaceae bacterium]